MKISKNQWIVIGIVGAIAIWYFFLRKKDNESGYQSSSSNSDDCPYPKCYCGDARGCSSSCCGGSGGSSVRKRRTTNESNWKEGWECPNTEKKCNCLGSPIQGTNQYQKTCDCCGGARVIKGTATFTA